MKTKFFYFFLLSSFILTSCSNNDECSDFSCSLPGQTFSFELLDSTTDENIFDSGEYSVSDITISDTDTDESINFATTSIDESFFIQLANIEDTQIVNYTFKLNDTEIFTFYVDVERVTEDCCTFSRYNEINLENATYSLNNNVYEVYIN